MENSPRQIYESENTKELLPTKDMEVVAVEVPSKWNDNLPVGNIASHEGFLAFKTSESGAIKMMPDTEASMQQLAAAGFTNGGENYAVPFTGAEAQERGSREFRDIEATMIYNLASMDAGLKELDYNSLSDEQRQQLEQIGFQGTSTGNGALIRESSGASFRISSGGEAPDFVERAADIGTYSYVPITYDTNQEAVPGVAFTDQAGNQTVTPRTEALDTLLESTGYRKIGQPNFDANVMSHLQGTYDSRSNSFDPVMQNKFGSFIGGSLMGAAINKSLQVRANRQTELKLI